MSPLDLKILLHCKQDMDFERHELCIQLEGLSKSQRIKLARGIV